MQLADSPTGRETFDRLISFKTANACPHSRLRLEP